MRWPTYMRYRTFDPELLNPGVSTHWCFGWWSGLHVELVWRRRRK